MDACDRERPVSDGEADAFRGTGSNVTRGENPRNCRLKRTGLAGGERPTTGLECIDARQHITQRITGNCIRQPRATGLRPYKDEYSGYR